MSTRQMTRPFDFARWLRPAPRRWYFVAWLNVTLVVALVSLSGSRLVLAPGLGVDLPVASEIDRAVVGNALVATVTSGEVVYFSGRRMVLAEFEQALGRELGGRPGVVLLLRADASVRVSTLLAVSSAARRAGVARLHLAAERSRAAAPGIREVR